MTAPIPQELILQVDPDLITSKNPDDQVKVWGDLTKTLKKMYRDLADAVNITPEFAQGGSNANPAEGMFQIWKDGAGKRWLAYNDGGAVEKIPFNPDTGQIDAATIADGSVSNTEFQYLNGVTSNLQEQINALAASTRLRVDDLYFTAHNYADGAAVATALGYGTWARYAEGQVPVGYKEGDSDFGTGGATGGEKTHTLTVAEMPVHTHSGAKDSDGATNPGTGNTCIQNTSPDTGPAGGDGAHNNLQPYIVVYVWKRTA